MSSIDAVMGKNMAINELTQNGKIGYVENNSFTFDGKTDGKLVLLDTFVRVSTKLFDLVQVESISICLSNGTTVDFNVGGSVFLMQGEPLSALVGGDGRPVVFTCTEEHFNEQYGTNIPVGVYVSSAAGSFISEVRCKETIHPIDPKYIPAMDSITLNGADGKQYKLIVSGGALNISEVV